MKKWIVTYYDTNSNRLQKSITALTADEAEEGIYETTKDFAYSVSVTLAWTQ